MSKGTLKPKGSFSRSKKTGIITTAVTAVFVAIGVVFMVVGYHDEVLAWMVNTGIAFLVLAALPLSMFLYSLISKRIAE